MAPGDDDHDDARALERPAAPRAPALRMARSLADAKVGEVIMLGRGGEALGPRRATYARVLSGAVVGASVLGVCLVYAQLFSPLAGVAAGAATAGYVAFRLRHWFRFRNALALISNLRWEEAHAALLPLERKRLAPLFAAQVAATLAALEALLGHPEAALQRLDVLVPRLRRTRGPYSRLTRWRAELLRVSLLARLGRLDEARLQRDAVKAEIAAWEARRRRARGEYLEVALQGAELEVAFAAGSPAELPDHETLHAWARAALLRTQFGSLLVLLAWAFDERGDQDMARHLLEEAPSRMPRSPLPAAAPALHAWAERRRAAWASGGE